MAQVEVNFHKYCKTCKYEKNKENVEPCYTCLIFGSNYDSAKPVKWKPKDED